MSGRKRTDIVPGVDYIFTKSGNRVQAIESTDYASRGSWVVQRSDTGKRMIVPGHALRPIDAEA